MIKDQSSVARGAVAPPDAEALMDRGFIQQAGNKLQRPNRLLQRLVDELPNDVTTLARLFGSTGAYEANVRGVFERRVQQLDGLAPALFRKLARDMQDLPEYPGDFIERVRGFANEAFEIIWEAEIPNRRIPSEWFAVWRRNKEQGLADWETTFPKDGARVRLLRLMTGSDQSDRCAKFVTKGTCVLMSAVHEFGNFGQHREGARIDVGAAYAALHLCIELAASLHRDLQGDV